MPLPRYFFAMLVLLSQVAGTRVSAVDLSRLDAAEAELEELVGEWQHEWREKADPASARQLAASLQALGIIERQAGKAAEALDHLANACDLFAAHAPDMLPDAAEARAITLQDLGELEAAEKVLREVLAAREASRDRAKLAVTYDHLALNLLFQGRYPEVFPLLDQAEAHAAADDAVFRARLRAHRGRVHHTLGSYSRAAGLFEEALALPFNDPELRLSLKSQLALSQLRLGKTAEALAGTEAAVEEARNLFVNTRFRAVPYLNNLGAIALSQGEPEMAASAFREALEMLESSFGPDHTGLIGPLNNLGVAEQELGDYTAARAHLERAAALQAAHLPPTHLRVAETQRNLARNSLLSGDPDAFDHITRATGIGLDLLDRLIREGSENERLNFIEHFDLVSLPCATGDAGFIANVLIASKARLLDAMLADSKPTDRITWRAIQEALPAGTAWVDACRYSTATATPQWRYGAVVILPTGPPKWVPLGSDESLERWLAAFHQRLSWRAAGISGNPGPPPPLKMRTILRALEKEFWAPLGIPDDIRHVAFSPDSRLHFLPLAALLDEKNQPLSGRQLQITTLTSARDLLNPPPNTRLAEKPWTILSIADFPKSPASPGGDPLLTLLAELEPMPGTRIEADKLKALAPAGSRFLNGPQTTEASLRQLQPAPSVLHLGCHAFFLHQQTPPAPGMPIDFDERSDLLFAGGLVLYRGALRQADSARLDANDDLLFPAEIARLPLQGTRLVSLSSCESGAGTPVSGEGLLGLRRAFAIAGARETLVALWPLADDSTPAFMERFYRLALASDRPAQALWQTQGEFLSAATADDDFELAVLRYAPFTLSQNSPLVTGPAISAASAPPPRGKIWWLLLSALPLLAFVASRIFAKGPNRLAR
jgi:CHAT domain-containing protein/tetratricopeptide (TPR) repeat protein